MKVSFTFRNMEPTEAIKAFGTEKVGKLERYLDGPTEVEIHAAIEGHHVQRVDLVLNNDGKRYVAHEESNDIYNSISVAIDKLQRQIRDAKDLETHRKRHHDAPG